MHGHANVQAQHCQISRALNHTVITRQRQPTSRGHHTHHADITRCCMQASRGSGAQQRPTTKHRICEPVGAVLLQTTTAIISHLQERWGKECIGAGVFWLGAYPSFPTAPGKMKAGGIEDGNRFHDEP
ncbi:hypothetical protein STEG23_038070, partial [Scotinomys teguina]